MIGTIASNTILNTALAEIKVTIIASTAMIMLVWDSTFTFVAIDREDVDRRWSRETSLVANSILTLIIDTSKFSEPSVAGSRATSDRGFCACARVHLVAVWVREATATARRGRAGADTTRLADKKFLEPTLNLGNRARRDPSWLLGLSNRACRG